MYRYHGQEAKVSLTLSDNILTQKGFETEPIPKEYKLSTISVKKQTMGVFSYVTRKYDIISKSNVSLICIKDN